MHIIFHFNLFLFFIYLPICTLSFLLVFLVWVSLFFFYSTTFWIPRCNFYFFSLHIILHSPSFGFPVSRLFIASLILRTLIHVLRPICRRVEI